MDEEASITIDIPQDPPIDNAMEKPLEVLPLSTNNPHIHNYNIQEGDTFKCECGELVKLAQVKTKTPAVPGAGPKCQYCEHKEKIQNLVDTYLSKFRTKNGGEKLAIPFIEELADVLDYPSRTLENWYNRKDKGGQDEHPDFIASYDKLMNIQKLRLKQRTLGRYNPTGAIFQLKANHGMIETEKKILTGDSNEPLLIEIVNEKKIGDVNE